MDFCSKTPEEANEFYRRAVAHINADRGYSALSHITMTEMGSGYALGELEVREDVLNPHGMVHGGCLSTLADMVGGMAALSNGHNCVTLSSNINYLRPAYGPKIYGEGRIQKWGSTVQVCEVKLTDDAGHLVASGTLTYYSLGPIDTEKF